MIKDNSRVKRLLVAPACGIAVAAPIATQAQDASTTLTTGITSMVSDGTSVGVAALAIFVAIAGFMVVKRFFFAGK